MITIKRDIVAKLTEMPLSVSGRIMTITNYDFTMTIAYGTALFM